MNETKKAIKNAASKVTTTLSAIKVPVPQDVAAKANGLTKTERKLLHITADHLFAASLQNLRLAQSELETIWTKKEDQRAKDLLDIVSGLVTGTESAINSLAEVIDVAPTVEQFDEIMETLKAELENTLILKLTDTDIPKEKMH